MNFNDLKDNESVSFTINSSQDGHILLSDFSRDGEDIEGTIEIMLNDTVDTPVGNLVVTAMNDSSISMPAVSKLFARERILIPSPAVAPVVSAAINVVSATEIPSRTAVKINGVVAYAVR